MDARRVVDIFNRAEKRARTRKKNKGPDQIIAAVKGDGEVACVRTALGQQTFDLVWKSFAERVRHEAD